MKNFGYNNSLEYMELNEYFSQEEKKLFLKIPHKIESHGKINVIDFDVPENGEYPVLRSGKIIEVMEQLTDEDLDNRVYSRLLYQTGNHDGEAGLFIQANHGSYALKLLKELYIHDKESAIPLLEDYFTSSVRCKDIIEISDIFIRQVQSMTDYLKKENLVVENLHLNYADLSNRFDSLNEDDAYEELLNLRAKYGESKDFPAYNDLDYTPMILDGDYCMYDSSGARFFVVKNTEESQKIYMIYRDRRELNTPINEWISDFIYDNNQYYLLLKETLVDSDLIAEIKDGKLIKSSIEMQTMNLLQSFIVGELVQEGKIIENLPNLSFKELLENYTRQNEFYGIEERAIIPLLSNLVLNKTKVTYTDFSQVPSDKKIRHEAILDHTLEELLGKDKEDKKLSYIYTKPDLSLLKKLPESYKQQINDYLSELLKRDSSENAQIFHDTLVSCLHLGINKKMKR